MQKKLLIIGYLLITSLLFCIKAQNKELSNYHQITYDLSLFDKINLNSEQGKKALDSVTKNSSNKDAEIIKSKTENLMRILQSNKIPFLLTIGENASYFTVKEELTENMFKKLMQEGISDKIGSFYTELNTGKVINIRNYRGNTYFIEDKQNKKWTITNERKNILGYKCIKATDSDNTVVWYTEDIKSTSGPLEFSGLEGTILELNLNGMHFIATEIKKLEKVPKIKFPKKGKVISKEDFEKFIKESEKE